MPSFKLPPMVLMLALAGLMGCERELILPGERFPVRAPLADSIPVEGEPAPVAPPEQPANETRAISLPGMVAQAAWTQHGGNAQHVSGHASLSANPGLVWTANLGAGNARRTRITAAPVVAGSVVYAMDALAQLGAFAAGSGAPLWRADLTAEFDRGGAQSGGGIAVEGGRVYATTGYGEVVAVDAASGAVLWRQRLGAPATGAPAVSGGVVYAISADATGWAIDAATGKVKWTLPAVENVLASEGGAAPAVTGNAVIFPFAAGVMLAADPATGTALWQAAITGNRLGRAYANSGDITGDPVVAGGVIYAGTAAGRSAAIDAASGTRLWAAEDGALNPPLVVGGSVFLVNDAGELVRLEAATGSRIWTMPLPYFTTTKPKKLMQTYIHFGPVLAGGRLITVSSDEVMRLYDPASGAVIGQVAIPGGAAADPALAGGMMYVVTGKGQLLAFR